MWKRSAGVNSTTITIAITRKLRESRREYLFSLFLHLYTPRLRDDLPHSIAMTTVRLFPLAPSPTSTRDWPSAVTNDSTCSPRSERRLARAPSLRSAGRVVGEVRESVVWRQPSTLYVSYTGELSRSLTSERATVTGYVIDSRSQSHRNCRTNEFEAIAPA